jgi:hypothetical protein
MTVVVMVANEKGMFESEIVNRYTYRQLIFLYQEITRSKFMLFEAVAKMFGDGKKSNGMKSSVKQGKGKRVIDLDGPLESLAEFVGGIGGNPASKNTAKYHQSVKTKR